MRLSFGELASERFARWAMPAMFAAIASAIFVRPYAVRAIVGGVHGTLRSIARAETYNRTVIASNYFHDGFVRRGLGGTIALLLSRNWNHSILLFIALSIVALVVPLALILRHLAMRLSKGQTLYLGLVLALSPQSFVGWARDPSRTDLLVAGCLAFAVLAWIHRRRAVALTLVLVGLLIHETAVVFGLPLLAALGWVDVKSGALERREAMRLGCAAILGIVVIVLMQMLLSAPPEVTARNMLAQAPKLTDDPEHRLWRDIAIYMAVGGRRALDTALCYNFNMASRYWPEFFGALAVMALYTLILPLRRHLLIAALVMWVPSIFMMLVANDTGRWLKLAVLDGWLIASFLLLRGQAEMQLSRRAMVIGAALLAMLLAMGSTRHNNVNDAYGALLLRLGYPDHAALDVWMNGCDPAWRNVVYGTGATSGR